MEAVAPSEIDAEFRSGLKLQFAEQVKALQGRTERKQDLLRDLQSFFSKQAEIETVYAQSLDKLYDRFTKSRRAKAAEDLVAQDEDGSKEQGLPTDVWLKLLEQTRTNAETRLQHATAISEEIKARLEKLEVDMVATSKKCVALAANIQSDLYKSCKDAEEKMKKYYEKQGALSKAEKAMDKAQSKGQVDAKKGDKLRDKITQAESTADAARSEYILAITSLNASKDRYFKTELGKLVDTMDLHFHEALTRMAELYSDMVTHVDTESIDAAARVHSAGSALDPAKDKAKFFSDNAIVFMERRPFECAWDPEDKVMSIRRTAETEEELLARYRDTEKKILELEAQVLAENATMATITSTRGKAGAMLGVVESASGDGAQASTDAVLMYVAAYHRARLSLCQRAGLRAELTALAAALGDKCPPPMRTDDGRVMLADEILEQTSAPARKMSIDTAYAAKVRDKRLRAASATPDSKGDKSPQQTSPATAVGTTATTAPTAPTAPTATATAPSSRPVSDAGGASPRLASARAVAAALTERTAQRSEANGDADTDAASNGTPTTATAASATLVPRRPAPVAAPPAAKSPPPPASGVVRSASNPRAPPPKDKDKPPRPEVKPLRRTTSDTALRPMRFGTSLPDLAKLSGRDVPIVVESCMRALDATGLTDEGLFRVSGSAAEVQQLRAAFERGEDPLLNGIGQHDAAAVAGCLKQFLRELSDPLMTRALYPEFLRIAKLGTDAAKLAALRDAIHTQLPREHLRVLEVLLPFLARVFAQCSTNKMTVANLAVVFGPTILPAPEGNVAAMMIDSQPINRLTGFLLENYEAVLAPYAVEAAKEDTIVEQQSQEQQPAQEQPPQQQQQQQGSAPVPRQLTNGGATLASALAPFGLPSVPSTPVVAIAQPTTVTITAVDQASVGGESDISGDAGGLGRGGRTARARHGYTARSGKEISFAAGEEMTVFTRVDKNWWLGQRSNGQQGYIAAAYVTVLGEGSPSVSPALPHAAGVSPPVATVSPASQHVEQASTASSSRATPQQVQQSALPAVPSIPATSIPPTVVPDAQPAAAGHGEADKPPATASTVAVAVEVAPPQDDGIAAVQRRDSKQLDAATTTKRLSHPTFSPPPVPPVSARPASPGPSLPPPPVPMLAPTASAPAIPPVPADLAALPLPDAIVMDEVLLPPPPQDLGSLDDVRMDGAHVDDANVELPPPPDVLQLGANEEGGGDC